MNMMPSPQGMMPQMPPPEVIEQAKLIADAITWEEIEPILRTDQRRNYCVDIETDSTVFEDAETEKAQRIELMGAMTTWLQQAIPAIQTNRSLAPLMKELTMFTLGGFKLGRTLEETFEDTFEQIQNMPEQPNPEAEKLKAEMQMAEQQFKMDMQLKQVDLQTKQQTAQITAQGKQADVAAKQQSAQMDMVAKQADLDLKRQVAELEIAMKQMQMQLEQQKLGMQAQKMQMDVAASREKAQLDREQMHFQAQGQREQHEMDREKQAFDYEMHQKMARDKAAQANTAAAQR